MKAIKFILFFALLILTSKTFSQVSNPLQKRVNIYVFDSPHKKKILSQTVWWRAKWHALWSGGKMIAFRAKSPESAAIRIEKIIARKHVAPGTIWLDSHGYYSNRQSTFYFGGSKINYRTINDKENLNSLQRIAALCNNHTQIILGACFTAATYNFPDKDSLKGRRMNGDSLLLAVAGIFKQCTVYGCQSWVMESPGIWHGKYKLEGAPMEKMYRDVLFKPAWQNLGNWTKYNPGTQQLEQCNALALNKYGRAFEKEKNFQSFKKVNKKIERNLCKLKPNLYHNKLKMGL